jgi:hypothetical protein
MLSIDELANGKNFVLKLQDASRTPIQSQLTGSHANTYQRLFQQPMPSNLQWRDVWSMLGAVADIITREDDKGNLRLTQNGRTLTLHRPRGKDLADKEELIGVRHFLEGSGALPPPVAFGVISKSSGWPRQLQAACLSLFLRVRARQTSRF